MLGSRVRAPKGALKTPFHATLWHMGARKGARFYKRPCFFFICGGKVSPKGKNWAREIATATCVLKRFPRTSHPKFIMTCANRAFLLTGKNSHDGVGCIKTSLRLLTSPAGVEPLEVRFAHPVRLAPDTHSQGHGRPCLQSLHPRRAFPATWFIFCDSFWIFIWCRLKRFPRTKHIFKASLYRLKRFLGTKSETDTSTSPFSGFRARETGVKEKNRVMGNRHSRVHTKTSPPDRVRTKTFSAHVTPEICHDVRKSGVFTHERIG